jgi:hypothetical protein
MELLLLSLVEVAVVLSWLVIVDEAVDWSEVCEAVGELLTL